MSSAGRMVAVAIQKKMSGSNGDCGRARWNRLTLLVTPTPPGKLRLLRSQHFVPAPLPLAHFFLSDLSISLNCNSKVTELKHTNWGAPIKGSKRAELDGCTAHVGFVCVCACVYGYGYD